MNSSGGLYRCATTSVYSVAHRLGVLEAVGGDGVEVGPAAGAAGELPLQQEQGVEMVAAGAPRGHRRPALQAGGRHHRPIPLALATPNACAQQSAHAGETVGLL